MDRCVCLQVLISFAVVTCGTFPRMDGWVDGWMGGWMDGGGNDNKHNAKDEFTDDLRKGNMGYGDNAN